MRVTLHQLKVFCAIVDAKSITAAAKSCYMTQPAVSNILKQLEQNYQAILIDWAGKRLVLTDAGNILYQKALQVLHTLEEAHNDISALEHTVQGTLRVSVVSTAKYFMPKLLGGFQQRYPDVRVELKVCNREEVIARLNSNLDDFVIMSQPPKQRAIVVEDFFEDRLVVACARHFSIGSESAVILPESLAERNWLMRERGSGTRMVMEKWFYDAGLNPNVVMEVGNNESIKQLIIANMGISILSQQSIQLELATGAIRILPVKGFPLRHEWYWVNRAGKSESKLVHAFKQFAQQQLANKASPC